LGAVQLFGGRKKGSFVVDKVSGKVITTGGLNKKGKLIVNLEDLPKQAQK